MNTVTDTGSGPASATFPLVTATNWTHAAEDPNDALVVARTPPACTRGQPTAGTPSGCASGVTSADNAGNPSANTVLAFTPDTTPPTGGTVGVPSSVTALSVPITTANFSDAGSGIATNVITRSNAQAISGGVCPTSGYTGSNTITGNPDTGVTTGNCYEYTLTGTDHVGNTATVTSSPVLVNTTALPLPFSTTTAGAYTVLVPASHAVTITNICGGAGGGGARPVPAAQAEERVHRGRHPRPNGAYPSPSPSPLEALGAARECRRRRIRYGRKWRRDAVRGNRWRWWRWVSAQSKSALLPSSSRQAAVADRDLAEVEQETEVRGAGRRPAPALREAAMRGARAALATVRPVPVVQEALVPCPAAVAAALALTQAQVAVRSEIPDAPRRRRRRRRRPRHEHRGLCSNQPHVLGKWKYRGQRGRRGRFRLTIVILARRSSNIELVRLVDPRRRVAGAGQFARKRVGSDVRPSISSR